MATKVRRSSFRVAQDTRLKSKSESSLLDDSRSKPFLANSNKRGPPPVEGTPNKKSPYPTIKGICEKKVTVKNLVRKSPPPDPKIDKSSDESSDYEPDY